MKEDSKKLRIYTGNRDIDKYVKIRQGIITEFLYKNNEDFFPLLSQYIGIASFFFNVTVLDSNYNFLDYIIDNNIVCKRDNITIITPDRLQSLEDVVSEAALNSMEILAITNISLLPSKTEIENGPFKYSRSEFSETIFGVYRWLHNVPIPWKIIGNISWSRQISNVHGVDSPGGIFRKTMIDMYKIEPVEDKESYKIIGIHKGKPKQGIKCRLDKKPQLYLPYIGASKKKVKPKDLFIKDIKTVSLKYSTYFEETTFINAIFNQFQFINMHRKKQ